MSADLLPDSRARESKGEWWNNELKCWMEVVYCGNCGTPWGAVTKGSTTFFFILCDKCVVAHGPPAGMMEIPNEEFFRVMQAVQMEEYGRYLTPEELHVVAEANTSPLARLIKEGRQKGILT